MQVSQGGGAGVLELGVRVRFGELGTPIRY